MPTVATPIRKRAGQRQITITLWRSDLTEDEMGGQPEGDFTQFGTAYAAVDDIPYIQTASDHGALYRVTVPYREDIPRIFTAEKKRVRIIGDGKALNLLEIENPAWRNIELVLHCALA